MIRTTCFLLLAAVTAPVHAAMFVAGADPTTTFSDLLIDDVTMGSGQDTGTATTFTPARNLDVPTGMGPVDISITGIGLNPRGGTSTTEETVTVEITYFGADNNFGLAADNVVLGSRTATLQYLGAVDQYTAVFDTPITGQIDGVEDRFRIAISSTGNLRFKSWNAVQSPSGENGLKVSVGGTATLAIPEPTSMALLGLLGLATTFKRR
ncbi:hypothetical protein MalM25_22670 [Planctomycetes bacterium MalM25]|nr:hypothetical protein MalM25_22670 [Planctomycetes bacterium MalM25]